MKRLKSLLRKSSRSKAGEGFSMAAELDLNLEAPIYDAPEEMVEDSSSISRKRKARKTEKNKLGWNTSQRKHAMFRSSPLLSFVSVFGQQDFKFRNFKKGVPDQQLSILMDVVYHKFLSCHEDPFAPLNPLDMEYHEFGQPHEINFGNPALNVNPSPPILPSPPTRSSVRARRAENISNNGDIRGGSTSNPSFNAMNETLYNQYETMNNQLRTEGHMIDDLRMYRPAPQFTRLELGSGSGTATSNDSKSYKQFQKIRNIYSKRIESFKKKGDVMLDALESELFSSSGTAGSLKNEQGFKSALVLINDMVLQNLIVEGSPLWCFAVSFIRNHDNRTAFQMLGSHMLRLTWIESEFNRATQFELQL